MDKITELAELFKQRDNPVKFDITTAIVVGVNPIVLKTSDKVFLSAEYGNLKVSASLLKDYELNVIGSDIVAQTSTVQTHSHTLTSFSATIKTTQDVFEIGDELIVIPISNGEMWYAIDKVVSI